MKIVYNVGNFRQISTKPFAFQLCSFCYCLMVCLFHNLEHFIKPELVAYEVRPLLATIKQYSPPTLSFPGALRIMSIHRERQVHILLNNFEFFCNIALNGQETCVSYIRLSRISFRLKIKSEYGGFSGQNVPLNT